MIDLSFTLNLRMSFQAQTVYRNSLIGINHMARFGVGQVAYSHMDQIDVERWDEYCLSTSPVRIYGFVRSRVAY
jgi:hypothetical protein